MKKRCSRSRNKAEVSRDFWERVDVRGQNECWVWMAGKTRQDSYGVMWAHGVSHRTHRFAYEDRVGQIPNGMLVCHKCDNPPCCNPSHLFLGTPLDNTRDCISKGRYKKEQGSKRYNAKLTEEAVRELKAQAPFRTYGWGRKMAAKYGVGPTAINNAIRGRRWKQIGVSTPIDSPTSHRPA